MASTHRAAEGSLGGSVAKTRFVQPGRSGEPGAGLGPQQEFQRLSQQRRGADPQASRLGEWRGGGEQRAWS